MKINKKVSIVLVFLLALSLIISGCGKVAEKASEQAVEKVIESETGEKVDLDMDNESVEITTDQGTIKAGATYDWPSGMPSDVPEFKYGSISSVIESTTEAGTSYTVTFEEVAADSFAKYRDDLEDKGWTMQLTQQMGSGWTLSAVKDNNNVTAVMGDDSTGFISFNPEMQ